MLEHEQWLNVAEYDLKSAHGLVSLELYKTAAYHSQQAAEKALKGYLAFKKQPIIKIHDLVKLLELCMLIDTNFGKFRPEVESLNPFATKFRYPSEFDIPDRAEMEQTVKYANAIVKFVLKKFKEPDSGQQTLFTK